jgi:hypothetical protein
LGYGSQYAQPGERLKIFRHLFQRRVTDGGGEIVADLSDASPAVDEVQRLIAEARPLPVRTTGEQARAGQTGPSEAIVELAVAEAVHRAFAEDAAKDRARRPTLGKQAA